jgi:flagellar hook-associated protein 2
MDLGVSGLASGFDWRSLVEQLDEVERAPQKRLLSEQYTIEQRNNAYGSILTQLGVLQNRLSVLKDPTLLDTRQTSVADTSVATATANPGAALEIIRSTLFNLPASNNTAPPISAGH